MLDDWKMVQAFLNKKPNNTVGVEYKVSSGSILVSYHARSRRMGRRSAREAAASGPQSGPVMGKVNGERLPSIESLREEGY